MPAFTVFHSMNSCEYCDKLWVEKAHLVTGRELAAISIHHLDKTLKIGLPVWGSPIDVG